MGLLDFLKRSKTHGDDDSTATNKNVARLGRVAAHKRAQNYDRMEAIQNLSSVGTADSAAALLKRFTFYIEPSITDQEEKDVAFRGILAAGAAAVEPIREFCVRAESLTWPMKLLEQLLDKDAYVDELLVLLGRFDTDYTKNVEPKVQLIAALEDKQRDDVRQAVEPFLQDANEPARFHAVATVFSQEQPAAAEALCQALVEEESVRIKNRICDGLSSRGWAIPDGLQDEVRKVLPAGFHLDGGKLRGGGQ